MGYEVTLSVDSLGVEFLGVGYDVTWDALEKMGVDHWVRQVEGKTWMTPELLRRFRALATAELARAA